MPDQDSNNSEPLYALIDYGDTYVQPLLLSALKSRIPSDQLKLIATPSDLPSPSSAFLHWAQYESLDFDLASTRPGQTLINSYVFRKALIRKHYLATTVRNWLIKHPSSVLRAHVKESCDFEVDYAEFLDDALVEAWELNESLAANEAKSEGERQWWILKPGMSDRGMGIRLFSSMEELVAIFECWDPESDDDDDDDDDEDVHSADGVDDAKEEGTGILTSQLRHFVAQPYIHPPLLLPKPFESANRKFHIRTYVVAVGAMQVYVYKPMLALFAGQKYCPPWSHGEEGPNEQLSSHLTNTCMQTGEREGSVHAFWSLPDTVPGLSSDWKQRVFEGICKTVSETFEAAARDMMIHFQPLPHAFEVYGIDFLVDAEGRPWLLEVNAFPDFAQTGGELSDLIKGLFERVVDTAIVPRFGLSADGARHDSQKSSDRMVKVLDIDLGRH